MPSDVIGFQTGADLIRNTFTAAWDALSTGITIINEEQPVDETNPIPNDPSKDNIELVIRENDSLGVTCGMQGHRRWRVLGQVFVHIACPIQSGTAHTRALGDKAALILRGVRVNNIYFRAPKPVWKGRVGSQLKFTVLIPFQYDFLG